MDTTKKHFVALYTITVFLCVLMAYGVFTFVVNMNAMHGRVNLLELQEQLREEKERIAELNKDIEQKQKNMVDLQVKLNDAILELEDNVAEIKRSNELMIEFCYAVQDLPDAQKVEIAQTTKECQEFLDVANGLRAPKEITTE